MRPITILLTTSGSGNANNVIRSLRKSKNDYRIIGTNNSKFEIGKSLADKNYLPTLKIIIEKEQPLFEDICQTIPH